MQQPQAELISQNPLKILSYNVYGLQNKIIYPDFFNYVNAFDIIFLSETHILQGTEKNLLKYFKDYDITWNFAIREANFGRGMGGFLVGLKKSSLKATTAVVKNINNMDIVELRLPGKTCHLLPLYLRSVGQYWMEDFQRLKNVL